MDYASLEALIRLVPRHLLPQVGEGQKLRATGEKRLGSLLPMLGEGLGMRVEQWLIFVSRKKNAIKSECIGTHLILTPFVRLSQAH